MFYYYWFNGRRLLDAPLEALLADPGIDMPFCLMWANENWTRRWDGSDEQVLVSQDYRIRDEPALVADLARHFGDARYIRLAGRPVVMVYRARLIPDAAATVRRWRRLFRDGHGADPVFIMAQSFGDEDPRPHGMDAAVEFPPHKLTALTPTINARLEVLDPAFDAEVYDYAAVASASVEEPAPAFPLIKTAVPGWDNDPRRQGAGAVLHGATPALYQAWLEDLMRFARRHRVAGEAIVCINAWNEWAEGATLEPDVHWGGAFLNATARAAGRLPAAGARTRILLVGHDALPHGAQTLLLRLGRAMRAAHGVEPAFLLLDGGPLEPDYQAIAPTTVARDAAAVDAFARAARAGGLRRRHRQQRRQRRVRARAGPPWHRRGAARARDARACCGIAGPAGAAAGRRWRRRIGRRVPRRARSATAALEAAGAARCRAGVAILPQGLDDTALSFGPSDRLLRGTTCARRCTSRRARSWRSAWAMPTCARASTCSCRSGGWPEPPGSPSTSSGPAASTRPRRTTWGRRVATAEATGSFRFLGHRDDAPALLAAADVFLLTSREDPLPSVALESLAAGTPVIAFDDTGGIPGLIARTGGGCSVPLGDAQSMARAALRLAGEATPESRTALAAASRHAFRFDAYGAALLALARPDLPRVSVVVPSCDYGRYMQSRLASIFAQSHPVLEVVVLDDASTDDSLAVAGRTAAAWKRHIHVEAQPRRSGSVFAQWLRAAERATGEWLWIAEADDGAEPGFLSAAAEALARAPGAAFAFTDSRAIGEDGGTLWADHKAYYGPGVLAADAVFEGAAFLREHLAERNLILNASAVLWRRTDLLAALRRCAPELQRLRVAGDWRVYAEVLAREGAQVAYVARPLNHHRRHGASVTARMSTTAHVAEVARVHAAVARLLGPTPNLQRRQRDYRRSLGAQLGLRRSAEPAS